jgi:catechol 2,3-dioxygenase-like lactoylglutathione lyase family enzyme
MIKGISLTDIFIDSKNPAKLREFYYSLTGWQKVDKYGNTPALIVKEGLTVLFVECDVPHEPPVWPEEIGAQQKQIHLDFAVDNLQQSVSEAINLGAKLAESQFGGEHWVTLLDPDGHPFCFGVDE